MEQPVTIRPYIPTDIVVHLGEPGSDVENVTVSFLSYLKNVACSEVYPTWHEPALRANILAQMSFALNRIYTEFYPSQGYDFNITSTTAYDQRYIHGRNLFDNVSQLVEELYTTYIRRKNHVEPLAARFCNGTTTQCDGLSQWGSESLAQRGYNSVEILRYYYGDDIELVSNAPIQAVQYSYPGYALRQGDSGPYVRIAQYTLNRVSLTYPAIPKIPLIDGYFGPLTEDAVKTFQRIFNLTPDGVIGKATWYQLVHIYTGILRLSELMSEGQTFSQIRLTYPKALVYGQEGQYVRLMQYLLAILSQFYPSIPWVDVDGVFGTQTLRAVKALQQEAGLPVTGEVEEKTWNALVDRFVGIDRTVLVERDLFRYQTVPEGEVTPEELQRALEARKGKFTGYIYTD